MSLKNSTVILTYEVLGSLALPGQYEYKERTSTGSILPEDQRLFTTRKSKDCECFVRVTLNEAFVNHAISEEGRPDRNRGGFKDFKAHTFWRKWSDTQRLNYHVAKYATDMNAVNYTFNVNEE